MDQLVLYGVNSARDVAMGWCVKSSHTRWLPMCDVSWRCAESASEERV